MQEDIFRLIELQKIDLEILKLEQELKKTPQIISKLQKESEILSNKISLLKEGLEEKERQKNLFEEELKEEQKRLKQTQARLTQIKVSREYQILLKEIEEIKRIVKQKEEEVLKLMEESEKLSAEKQRLEENYNKLQETLREEVLKFENFCDSIRQQKEELLKKREQILVKISSTAILRKYELVRERRGGIGICPVENGICEGCYMAIPPQLYNELQRDNRFYECPHCKRIIYYKRIYLQEENLALEEK